MICRKILIVVEGKDLNLTDKVKKKNQIKFRGSTSNSITLKCKYSQSYYLIGEGVFEFSNVQHVVVFERILFILGVKALRVPEIKQTE